MTNAIEFATTITSIKVALARKNMTASEADMLAYAVWGRKNGFFSSMIVEEMIKNGKAK